MSINWMDFLESLSGLVHFNILRRDNRNIFSSQQALLLSISLTSLTLLWAAPINWAAPLFLREVCVVCQSFGSHATDDTQYRKGAMSWNRRFSILLPHFVCWDLKMTRSSEICLAKLMLVSKMLFSCTCLSWGTRKEITCLRWKGQGWSHKQKPDAC